MSHHLLLLEVRWTHFPSIGIYWLLFSQLRLPGTNFFDAHLARLIQLISLISPEEPSRKRFINEVIAYAWSICYFIVPIGRITHI